MSSKVIKSQSSLLYTRQFGLSTLLLSNTNPDDGKEESEIYTKPFSLSTTSPEETHCHIDPYRRE
jgi:hypothetical protein